MHDKGIYICLKMHICQHISGSDGEVVVQVAADSAAANMIDLEIVATYD